MATKPDAARGKTTRIGKIKKIIKGIKAKPKTVGMGMSPGAMGGRTSTDVDKLNGLRDTIQNTMESILNPVAAVGSSAAFKRARQIKPTGRLSTDDRERASKKRGGKMSTGGEVDIDMTTETDV